jgi:hypothetical protein
VRYLSIANKGDNYEICVNNTGGKQCVSCPNLAQPAEKQTCSAAARSGKGGRKARVAIASLLAGEDAASPPKDDGGSKGDAKP